MTLEFGVASAGSRSGRAKRAARSRATPSIDQASGRLPSTEMSKMTSGTIPSASVSRSPTAGSMSSSRIMRPSWSSLKCSSRDEQSMPFEITPRIVRRRSRSPPGSTAPTGASGTWLPTSKFIAPQTISSGPSPASTDDQANAVGALDGADLVDSRDDHVLEALAHALDALDDEAQVVEGRRAARRRSRAGRRTPAAR